MIQNPQASLRFGALDLASDDGLTPYRLYAAGEDGTWGNPDPVVAIVDSLLGDGQLASVVRHNNREAQFGIVVRADDGMSLAAAEAALVAETEKQNVLVWTSPDGYAPDTVFDVVTSWLEHTFDDLEELRLERHYILRLTLYPHSRSATSTSVPALGSGIDPTVPPVESTVSTASSLTGWSGRTVVAGKVDAIALGGSSTYVKQTANVGLDLWLTYDTGAVQTWAATPYLVFDWAANSYDDAAMPAQARVSGPLLAETEIPLVLTQGSPFGGNWKRSTFDMGANANLVRYVKFFRRNDLTGPADGRWNLLVTNVKVTDGGATNDGTSRQLARSLNIGGSARAMGVIDVQHANALGDVLVWSGPAACAPQLRRLRVSGAGETVDATLVSGAYEALSTAFTADVPLSSVPSGAYLVMARLKTTSTDGTYPVDVTAQTRLATSDTTYAAVGPTLTIDDARVDLLAASYTIVPLGIMHLPAAEVAPGSDGMLRVTLQGANIRMDEAWLFNITDGDLTQVTGADKVLRITSPSLSDPRWRVWTGPTDTALYDAGALMNLRGQHLLNPGPWNAFTVTTGGQDAAVSLTYDKRWHTNAGEDG